MMNCIYLRLETISLRGTSFRTVIPVSKFCRTLKEEQLEQAHGPACRQRDTKDRGHGTIEKLAPPMPRPPTQYILQGSGACGTQGVAMVTRNLGPANS